MFVSLVCAGMVVTAAVDDARIAGARGTSIAQVLDVGTFRTSVRFQEASGTYVQPSAGLRYPVGLVAGQRVRVDYQLDDPENVKVQGRSWTLAWLPAISSWLVLMGAVLLLRWFVTWCLRRFVWRVTQLSPAREVVGGS